MLPKLVQEHLPEIVDLCRRYGVARLEIFGSACTPEFDPARSDVDFLVTYPPGYDYGPWASRLQDLETDLATLLGRDVDLVLSSVLEKKRFFRREADKTRAVLYDAREVAAATG